MQNVGYNNFNTRFSHDLMRQKKWILQSEQKEKVIEIQQRFGYSYVLSKLLADRIVDFINIADFLEPKLKNLLPDPIILEGCDKAAKRISKAIKAKEQIGIIGDYDVDGASSVSLLFRFLRWFDITPSVYIPNRLHEGYGPSIQAFQKLNTKLVIIVDCGTMAFDPLQYAKDQGIEVIVIDHHLPSDQLPECFALINPNCQKNIRDDLKGMCAAGLVFLFLIALKRQLGEDKINVSGINLLDLLDIVALATVCDVMPLQGLNRALVKQGLKMAEIQPNLGIKHLCQVSKIDKCQTAMHLGFMIGPRINAGGRIGDSNLGFQILSEDDEVKVNRLARILDELNLKRRDLETHMLKEAIESIETQKLADRKSIVVASPNFHPGIMGIMAGRILEMFQKPAFVIALTDENIAQGSARSLKSIDVGRLLQKALAANHLISGGGHSAAGGFKVHKNQINDFYQFIEEELNECVDMPNPLLIDLELPLSAICLDLFLELKKLEPYGQGNPEPLIKLSNVYAINVTVLKNAHIKCQLQDRLGNTLEAIAFNGVRLGMEPLMRGGGSLEVVGSLNWNKKVGLRIVDVLGGPFRAA